MLTANSLAKGVSPQEIYDIIGSELVRNVPRDRILSWEDLHDSIDETYDTSLDNWGTIVRFSDIDQYDWGDSDIFEFRINGADIDQEFDLGRFGD